MNGEYKEVRCSCGRVVFVSYIQEGSTDDGVFHSTKKPCFQEEKLN